MLLGFGGTGLDDTRGYLKQLTPPGPNKASEKASEEVSARVSEGRSKGLPLVSGGSATHPRLSARFPKGFLDESLRGGPKGVLEGFLEGLRGSEEVSAP